MTNTIPESDPRIAHLAGRYGIATEFWDWKGRHHQSSPACLVACLKALGVDVDADQWLDQALVRADERRWQQPLPDCVVVEQHQDRHVDVHVQAGREAHVWVRLEDGATFALDQIDNEDPDRLIGERWVGRASFRLPTWVAPGYHMLYLESQDRSYETAFIVTPPQVGTPGLEEASVWGLMVQLYSVCGAQSWGIGDFADLADLAVWAKTQHQADFILINPIHAAEVVPPMEPSPYLPVTRHYTNPIYIRPEMIAEYATAPDQVRDLVQQYREQARLGADRDGRVQRDPVWEAKKAGLWAIFQLGRLQPRQQQLEAYLDEQGTKLRGFATWCALCEVHGSVWSRWPTALQDPDSDQVRKFADQHKTQVDFYIWLQWIAHLQARQVQATALEVGMRIGILFDLAVGANPAGQETWATADLFASGVKVGAPPDAYNQFGQNWQQPPWRPDRLEAAAYAPWRALVASILAQAGGVRIDHIMGLFRLWWIPDGADPTEGAYLRYDHEAMVGILALEAQRAGAIVIGEDLGTVEPWVRRYLARRGILGTSVLWFENSPDGQVLAPEQWRELCMASVTTHDLPPTLSYLAHDHVGLRYQLGLLTESLEDEIARDAAEQAAVRRILVATGLVSPPASDPQQILLGLHRFLRLTPARLKCVALTDLVGETRIQNQPGTIDEYPNWQVGLADQSGRRLSLERIYEMTRTCAIADIMNG